MSNKQRDKADDELVQEADHGLRGQGALVEMMRRLKDALLEQGKSTERITTLTQVLVWFTGVMIILAVVQILLLFWPR